MAADGPRVALATDGIAKSCDRVVVWNTTARSFSAFKAGTHCPGAETSGGQELQEIALADRRVAWLERAAGNLEDLTLRTAGLGGPRISTVEVAENGNGAQGSPDGGYVGNVFGDGDLIAYNTWRVCTVLPPGAVDETAKLCEGPQPAVSEETHAVAAQRLWKLVRGKKSPIGKGPQSYPVVAVDAGRIAVRQESGTMILLSSSGAVLRRIATSRGAVRGAALQGNDLVVLRSGGIDVYDARSGTLARTIPLPAGKALLRDVHSGLAVYVEGLVVHVVRLADGKSVSIKVPGSRPVDAQIEAPGLFYSYTLPGSTAKGRIAFLPLSEVKRKL